jgi:hypothetical protein
MTNPDPPNDGFPIPSISADEKPQHDDDGDKALTGLDEDECDQVCCGRIIYCVRSVH